MIDAPWSDGPSRLAVVRCVDGRHVSVGDDGDDAGSACMHAIYCMATPYTEANCCSNPLADNGRWTMDDGRWAMVTDDDGWILDE